MFRRYLLLTVLAIVLPTASHADGPSPADAAKRMKLPDGFSVTCVASEPMIRQPVSISFDDRGRMWVLQYLQYPNYAGLKPVRQDQYLRTIWDRVPEPPPHGPKGADCITILSDPDETGVYRKSKDFVTGLNIASGFCLGHGGVYVAQTPYLLYYPDRNADDVPDGNPEVLLTGFGMDDTHSLANSLQWGPDGWLYGAAGSTSTCRVKNPAHPAEPVVEFQQGLWRYHPLTKRFELFSEGGGNTYGLDFDRHGQAIAGTNWGGFACLHQFPLAYYIKGFSKHGPLHNPHTYGYFDHVPYTGFRGGHVTCGGVVYQADRYPERYRNQYVAANLLSNAVYWHKLDPVGASFRASHGGELIETDDNHFRPVDCLQGPDGCVYVVDFTDKRAAHLDPVDSWDRTNGRIYRLDYGGTPKPVTKNLRTLPTADLIAELGNPNKWWRNEARLVLAERRDPMSYRPLRDRVFGHPDVVALEHLWAVFGAGGFNGPLGQSLLRHQDEHVRAWAVRLLGETPGGTDFAADELKSLAATDPSPVVVAQLACTARTLKAVPAALLVGDLRANPLVARDASLQMLLWWAVESNISQHPSVGGHAGLPADNGTAGPVYQQLAEKTARRLMAADHKDSLKVLGALFAGWEKHGPDPLLKGMATALQGRTLPAVPAELRADLTDLREKRPADDTLLEVLARMNDPAARRAVLARVTDESLPEAARLKAVALAGQVKPDGALAAFRDQLGKVKSDALRVGFLGGLETFDDAALAPVVLDAYAGWSPKVKQRGVQLLLSRPTWGKELFRRVEAGTFPKADLTVEHAKAAVGLNDAALTALVEKQFGKLQAATAGEKQARISWLNVAVGREKGADAGRGKALYTKHCAACHTLHGEGGKVGPDLTTADRKNRGYLLAQIVDPSGYIRPEFVVQTVGTLDGRRLSGIVEPSAGDSVTLVNVVNDQPVRTVLNKADVDTLTPSAVSLMPEKLLDTLTDAQVADLLAYVAADAPKKADPPAPAARGKLRVVLVSGSFEYKSDESLAAFRKQLESANPVECVTVAAKAEKDANLPGLEALEKADVAVFFTRRLQIKGDDLERVKKYVASGKPVVGVRTASHGFQNWLPMDAEVFGGDYKGHFGAGVVADVTPEKAARNHPVLKGVAAFKSNGSLYKNPAVASDVTVLLRGAIPKQDEPVAWLRERGNQRVFYTSLGHPDDFRDANFLRLLVNAIAWTSRTELSPGK
ncbi:PVC-type heme-binding CxxCH protein [Urbifossiella limnaea]|uniref:Trehalose utilization n=1 Tax=Urbifossiella limnaea TaxID=2528023 RepID=A0A517XVN8_9BACT|nr:PVC-type heme-binding CxxCH protein [Urbifossiella limnaea]QDU21544.1 Trehalose utilization [Urbifossiella limnaea]